MMHECKSSHITFVYLFNTLSLSQHDNCLSYTCCRMRYLKDANLFVEDVHKELDMEDREKSWDEYKEKHGMGLGLW